MSNSIKVLGLLAIVAFAAGCAREPEPVMAPAAPVTAEPVYTGKYG